ncbi:MAG: efflux RND transporter permease subunit [Nitrospinota bacterium]|nr:efflux RND transporter permease subunit [Nitrospinota bacterium]
MINSLIKFFLENKLVTILFIIGIVVWGWIVMPFDVREGLLPRNPVPVDAFPDIGENQQIVFTDWMGRSPQDVEDQITYPLAIGLQGIPGVKSIRSYSAFGFSSIYIIFKDDIDFYWSRSRVLERLSSVTDSLPEGVTPILGPDATALGQVFWYTVEGEGFGLDELRSVQDWYVKYALQSTEGVSEVASIGGFVREYQIDVNPDAMRLYNVSLEEVMTAVKKANIDIGAKTIELNSVEYIVRGIGFIKTIKDIEKVVVKENNNVPVYVENIATQVSFGPALRRGALNKEGAEVVGGVAVVRYGENPMAVIKRLKDKIKQIEPGLPTKMLEDGRVSKVKIVPFYDRTQLINETLGTLSEALSQEILITIFVILIFLMHFKSSLVVSITLPIAVLMTFIMMKTFKVDANIMSLGGIAIAIGTIVDMGIIMCENILTHLEERKDSDKPITVIYNAASEVGSAILTAISTTVVSFLAVFTMVGPEGKLFKPLAYTKTFALLASVILALFLVPALADLLFVKRKGLLEGVKKVTQAIIIGSATIVGWKIHPFLGIGILAYGLHILFWGKVPDKIKVFFNQYLNWITVAFVLLFITKSWMPLGFGKGFILNLIFVSFILFSLIFFFFKFTDYYPRILTYFLEHKKGFLGILISISLFGVISWIGFAKTISPVTKQFKRIGVEETSILGIWPLSTIGRAFPGLGKEFMPPLDEGSYLYMPATMPHASIGEVLDILQKQNIMISQIPEVSSVVGKLGRAESPLDMAPISMIETIVSYKPEYSEPDQNTGLRKRLWRDHIKSQDDIWKEIVKAGAVPGVTSSPKLQPIAARIVMLQSGMRAPMGIKILGQNLADIEELGFNVERLLKDVPGIEASAVIADRIVGTPYLEFYINREKIARYGVNIVDVQNVIEAAIGGMPLTTTVEGRERYQVRIRYSRELRDSIEDIQNVLVPTQSGAQIPLSQLSTLKFTRGPQNIKSEDTFLVGYVLFDKEGDIAEVDVVNRAQKYLEEKIESGELIIPAGTSYKFAGNYENQIRSEKKLAVVLPLSLFIIFLLLYFQFESTSTTILVFSGIVIAMCGGFIFIWLYSQEWFLSFPFFGDYFRNIFNMGRYNLSVAVWIGFLALFGIASDNGVVIATYLDQRFKDNRPNSVEEIREATLSASQRRVRPCLMTTATTILALLPILTSTGRGADVMLPMALPSVGGMMIALITFFVVPVGYCWLKERELEEATTNNA